MWMQTPVPGRTLCLADRSFNHLKKEMSLQPNWRKSLVVYDHNFLKMLKMVANCEKCFVVQLLGSVASKGKF